MIYIERERLKQKHCPRSKISNNDNNNDKLILILKAIKIIIMITIIMIMYNIIFNKYIKWRIMTKQQKMSIKSKK